MTDLECSNTSNSSAISYNLIGLEYESFDETDLTHAFNEKSQQMICGEIVLNNKRRISFNCSFCDTQMRNLEAYLKHILKNHLELTKEETESVLNEVMEEQRASEVKRKKASCYPEVQEEGPVNYSVLITDNNKLQGTSENYLCHFEQFLTDSSIKAESLKDLEEVTQQENASEVDYGDIELLDNSFEELKTGIELDNIKYEFEVLEETSQNDDNELKESKDTKTLNFKNPHKTTCLPHTISKSGVLMCTLCPKRFKNKSLLSVHTKRHTSNKPFICEYCDARFADSSNFKVHVNRHLGIKPHCCALCEKSFISTTELKLHMRSHTGEKPYVCEECGRKFSSSGHLKSHRRRHYNERPFECETCGKDFYDRRLLRDHEAAHSNDRPFECDICNTTFKRQKALSEHKKLHSGIRNYKCKICLKAFAQNAGLWSHMKQHHSLR